jgi:hypothetical protein
MMKSYKFLLFPFLILPMYSFAANDEQRNLCQFKQKFDDSIPADKSFIQFGNDKKFNGFFINKLLHETIIHDCLYSNNKFYVLSQTTTTSVESLAQSLIYVTTFDQKGTKLKDQIYNKDWSCAINQKFLIKNHQKYIDMSCTEKNNLDNGLIIDQKKLKKYQVEVK